MLHPDFARAAAEGMPTPDAASRTCYHCSAARITPIGIYSISVPLIAQKSAPLERFRSDGIKSGRAQKL
jgi:hypothetical protein